MASHSLRLYIQIVCRVACQASHFFKRSLRFFPKWPFEKTSPTAHRTVRAQQSIIDSKTLCFLAPICHGFLSLVSLSSTCSLTSRYLLRTMFHHAAVKDEMHRTVKEMISFRLLQQEESWGFIEVGGQEAPLCAFREPWR